MEAVFLLNGRYVKTITVPNTDNYELVLPKKSGTECIIVFGALQFFRAAGDVGYSCRGPKGRDRIIFVAEIPESEYVQLALFTESVAEVA